MNLAVEHWLQDWSKQMRKLSDSLKSRISEAMRRHWKPIAIVLILAATVLPGLAYAKALNINVSLSTGEIWSGYCCGSLVYRTSFYGWDTSKALASLLIVTNSSWVSSSGIYMNLWHLPKLERITLQLRSLSTSLGEVTWKDGGIVPLWNSSMREHPVFQ